MRKKVKRIPKYNGGTGVVMPEAPINTEKLWSAADNMDKQLNALNPYLTEMSWADMNAKQKTGSIIGAAGTAVNLAANSIGKPVTVAGVANGALQGAAAGAAIGGPWGAFIGGAIGGVTSAVGSNYADENGVHNSGLASLVGNSPEWLAFKHNRMRNSVISQLQTENLKADYMNQYGGAVKVAEGGIMRRPVDALVSKGELIYDPTTLKLRQVPGSKGKPNKADDVYAKLYEGDVVISNSPTMLMANGKTPAQNLMGMVDKYATGGTVKAREAIIKKVVNWQEANKTKPQEYAKFDEGNPGFFSYLMSNRTRPIDAVISEYMKQYGKTAKEFKGFDGSDLSFLQSLQNLITANDKYVLPIRFKGGKSFDQVRSMPISSAVEFNPEYWNYYNQSATSGNVAKVNADKPLKPLWQPTKDNKTTHPEIDPVWSRHKTSDFVATEAVTPTLDVPAVSEKKLKTTVSKKGDASKPSSGKKTTVVSQDMTPAQINQTQIDWARQAAAEAMAQYKPNTTRPIAPGLVAPKVDPTETVEELPLPGQNDTKTGSNGSNWQDGLYRMAVLSQPLWDRAKAEPIDWTSPVYKYMPTQIDVNSQFRDADQSYALARYNFANLYPNTGAGMAAGLQAASDRAKQYADIRQWQTNAQNELIGKNVGIYNNLANEHARILNDVYNKSAQNRAAARNINRQNRAAALKNWGTMLSDDKKMAMERMKFNILKPAIRSTYEDDTVNDLMNMYNSLFR